MLKNNTELMRDVLLDDKAIKSGDNTYFIFSCRTSTLCSAYVRHPSLALR